MTRAGGAGGERGIPRRHGRRRRRAARRAPGRAVVVPAAAGLEGDDRVAYWLELARRHYEAMGVEPVLLDVRTRADADDPAIAALVDGAGLVYLSGGDPHHLAATLRDSALWDAIVAAWQAGAALAGCSAGAMALTVGCTRQPPPRRRRISGGAGTSRRAPTGSARGRGPGRHPPFRPDGALRGPGRSSGSPPGNRRARPWWGSRRRRPWWGRAGRGRSTASGAVWVFDADGRRAGSPRRRRRAPAGPPGS